MKKVTAFFMTLTLIVGILTGCGNNNGRASTAKDESTKAAAKDEIAGTLTVAVTEDRVKFYEPVFQEFMKKYPDVKVEFATFADFTATNQGVQAAHQAGDDYDILTVNHVDTMTYQKAGMLYPIGDLAERDGVNFDEVFMGSLMEPCKIGGKAYTIPTDTDTRVIFYNKDLFEKYNLEYPATLEEVLECGKAMTKDGDYLFTNALTSSAYQSTYEMGVFLQSIGGSLYKIDDNGKPVATVDTPEMKKYLEFVKELQNYMPEDSVTMEGTEQRNQFCNGNIGMMESGPWEYGEIDMEGLSFTVELGLIPAGDAGSYSTSGGFQLGIGSKSNNVETAWTFIKWLTENPDQAAAFGGTNLPTIEAAYNEGTFADSKYDIFKEQLKTSNIPQIPVANLNEVMNTFDEYWQNLLFDKMTPDEVCQKAQTAIQEVLDENK